MMIKRLHDREDPKPGPGRVKIIRVGQRQQFTVRHISGAVMGGYMTLAKGRIVLHAVSGDVVFRILRVPGMWCRHCGAMLDDSAGARRHVIDRHPGVPSPDRNNPSGYEQLNAFECERE